MDSSSERFSSPPVGGYEDYHNGVDNPGGGIGGDFGGGGGSGQDDFNLMSPSSPGGHNSGYGHIRQVVFCRQLTSGRARTQGK